MGTTSVVPQKLRKTQGFSPCGMLCAGRAAFMQPVLVTRMAPMFYAGIDTNF
jgi:hypothetical protein